MKKFLVLVALCAAGSVYAESAGGFKALPTGTKSIEVTCPVGHVCNLEFDVAPPAMPTVVLPPPPPATAQPVPAPSAPTSDCRSLFKDGTKEYDLGQYAEAIALFEAAYRLCPDLDGLLFNIGQARLKAAKESCDDNLLTGARVALESYASRVTTRKDKQLRDAMKELVQVEKDCEPYRIRIPTATAPAPVVPPTVAVAPAPTPPTAAAPPAWLHLDVLASVGASNDGFALPLGQVRLGFDASPRATISLTGGVGLALSEGATRGFGWAASLSLQGTLHRSEKLLVQFGPQVGTVGDAGDFDGFRRFTIGLIQPDITFVFAKRIILDVNGGWGVGVMRHVPKDGTAGSDVSAEGWSAMLSFGVRAF